MTTVPMELAASLAVVSISWTNHGPTARVAPIRKKTTRIMTNLPFVLNRLRELTHGSLCDRVMGRLARRARESGDSVTQNLYSSPATKNDLVLALYATRRTREPLARGASTLGSSWQATWYSSPRSSRTAARPN